MPNIKEQDTAVSKQFSNNQSSSKALRVWIDLDIDASENENIEDLAQRYFKNTNQNPDNVYWLPIIKTQTENGFLYRTSQNKELTKADAEGFVYLSDSEVQVLFEELGDAAFNKLGDSAPPLLDTELELAAQKVMDKNLSNYSGERVMVMSIYRFNKLIKGSEMCLYIGKNTSDEDVRSVLTKYVLEHKNDIVENTVDTPVGEEEICFRHTREELYKRIMGHINHGLPIDSMTQYWRIPDGFNENMDHVNSYIRMRFQTLIKI